MERLRVLHLVPEFGQGGAERVALQLMFGLCDAGFEVQAVSMFSEVDEVLRPELHELSFTVHYLDKAVGFDLRVIARIDRVIRAFRPHVIHTHLNTLRYAWLSAWRRRVPVHVHTVHNVAEKEVLPVDRAVHAAAFRCGVVPVAVSEQVVRTLRRVYGHRTYVVIPNGIPSERFRTPALDPGHWRRREGFRTDDVLFVSVGRLHRQKGIESAIGAFSDGVATESSTHLVLVGDGPEREKIEREIRRRRLEGRVHLLGMRRDVPEVLHAADVFVLSSRWEGVPLVIMEAMAAGKAIISTRVGRVPHLIEHGISGLLVEPGDEEALGHDMQTLLQDDVMRRRLGAEAARRAQRGFDVEQMVRAYAELYQDLWHETRAAAG